MSELVIGAAYGYRPNDLKPFILSLRRHYDGDVLFITDTLDEEFTNFYNDNTIITLELDNILDNRWDMQHARFKIYKDILEEHFQDTTRILLTDTRDVVFQDNPFNLLSNLISWYSNLIILLFPLIFYLYQICLIQKAFSFILNIIIKYHI